MHSLFSSYRLPGFMEDPLSPTNTQTSKPQKKKEIRWEDRGTRAGKRVGWGRRGEPAETVHSAVDQMAGRGRGAGEEVGGNDSWETLSTAETVPGEAASFFQF